MAANDRTALPAATPGGAARLHCARCGDRIGVYERYAWKAPDGSIVPSVALRAAGSAGVRAGWLPYHQACVAAA